MNCGNKPHVALLETMFPEISALFKGNYTPLGMGRGTSEGPSEENVTEISIGKERLNAPVL